MLQEFWHNFTHNLFKPLLLFFYFGFLIPILKVRFEFPYVIYQGLTMYLLLAIG
ncbi:sodium-dependent bicarbonate transport family permease, partial [Mycobacterium avium]